MDSLTEAFLNNNVYKIHHIHLTFEENFELGGILKANEFTKIELPYGDGVYTQVLTTIKVLNESEFFKYIDILKPYESNIIGFKLEGVLFDKKMEDIKDFIYYEEHSKNGDLEFYKTNNGFLSYSCKNKKFMDANRIYDKYNIPDNKKIEVCYFEHWLRNIEQPWKNCKKEHYDILKNMIKK